MQVLKLPGVEKTGTKKCNVELLPGEEGGRLAAGVRHGGEEDGSVQQAATGMARS